MTRVLRFGIVGLAGFLVDAGSLMLLVGPLAMSPYVARVPSFVAAATTTWLCNRYWTFADRRNAGWLGEWSRYLIAMLAGGLVNYAVFAAALLLSDTVRAWPVIGVALGSLAGMAVNYLSSARLIFGRDRSPPPAA